MFLVVQNKDLNMSQMELNLGFAAGNIRDAHGASSKLIEMTDQRFGRLLVMERSGRDAKGQATWRCLCDCGKNITASGTSLRSGNTMSCGCLRRERCGRHRVEMAGRQFGRWTVIEKGGLGPGGHALWLCRCQCGTLASVSGDNLRLGRSRSCGCWNRLAGLRS
jgi:hypothetical protein